LVKDNITKYLENIEIKLAIFLVILLSMVIAFLTSTQVYAISFSVSRAISAPVDEVWNVISNAENDTRYWPDLITMKNIDKNTIERVVTISLGPQNNTSHQLVSIYPGQMKIETNFTEGLITGTKTLKLESIYEDKSEVRVTWNFDFSSGLNVSRGTAAANLKQTTVDAVQRIAEAAKKL